MPAEENKSIFTTLPGYKSLFGDWITAKKEKDAQLKNTSAYFLNQDIYVYELIDWRTLQKNIQHIKNIFFKALNVDGKLGSLTVKRISGWISYKNSAYVNRKPVSGSNFSTDVLDAIVRTFIKNITTAHQDYSKQNDSFDIPSFFQAKPELLGITTVYTKNNQIRSWIVQYEFTLPLARVLGFSRARVKDSLLEVVIDSFGSINSILLRWRPVKSKINSKLIKKKGINEPLNNNGKQLDLTEFIHANYIPAAHKHGSGAESSSPAIEYQLAGDNSYQTHLAPFLTIPTGHHAQRLSIVRHSIKISFIKIHSTANVKILADISGGSGKYTYAWACWEIANRENYTDLGSQEYCTVLGGALHVILTVIDEEYKITEQFQEFVYALQPSGLQFQRNDKLLRYGCTDPKAKNYDPNANCDDSSCKF
jgi:hypothetical protein